MSSDNIDLLTIIDNIPSLTTFVSNKVILGQYISINVIARSDQDLRVTLQFSANGVDWDYSINNTVLVGDNSNISNPVVAKYFRLLVSNLGLLDTTYLRVYVYGTPSNSAALVQLQKVGGLNPTVDVGNQPLAAYGEMNTVTTNVKFHYLFDKGIQGNMATNSWTLPYRGFISYGTPASNGQLYFNDRSISIGNHLPGEILLLQGPYYRLPSGTGLVSRFSGKFIQGIKNVSGLGAAIEFMGVGNSILGTGNVNDFIGFGYGDSTLPATSLDSFGIIYVRAGVRVFIPRTSWNVDPADGTGVIPSLNWALNQTYSVQIQYGSGNIIYSILNPNTSIFTPVHVYRLANTVSIPLLQDPSLGLLLYTSYEAGSVPVTLIDRPYCDSFSLGSEGVYTHPDERASVFNERTIPSGETLIVSLRCDPTWYSLENRDAIDVNYISFSCDGTKPVSLCVFVNATIAGTPNWIAPYPNTFPISRDVDQTFVSGVGGVLVFVTTLDKTDSISINLADLRAHLNPGDQLNVMAATTATSDIGLGIGFTKHF